MNINQIDVTSSVSLSLSCTWLLLVEVIKRVPVTNTFVAWLRAAVTPTNQLCAQQCVIKVLPWQYRTHFVCPLFVSVHVLCVWPCFSLPILFWTKRAALLILVPCRCGWRVPLLAGHPRLAWVAGPKSKYCALLTTLPTHIGFGHSLNGPSWR